MGGMLIYNPKPAKPPVSKVDAGIGWVLAASNAKVILPTTPLVPSDSKQRGPHSCKCDFYKEILVNGCRCGGI